MKKRTFLIILLGIMTLGGILRTYKITNSIADWHSWRQVDTAAVARNFINFGLDPLHPRYDDLSNIQSGKDNPNGYRMVEFPIYQILGYGVFRFIPHISIEVALRIVNIVASIGTIGLVGILGKKTGNGSIGLASAFFFAVLPYSVYYGRTILPEPIMVFFSLLSLVLVMVSKEYQGLMKYGLLCISAGIAAIALLIKPFAIFLLLPLPYLFLVSVGVRWVGIVMSVFCFGIAVGPLILWRQWIIQFPEGIPVYTWLFNEGNIRFKGAWFYWLFAERIAKLILGYWGVAFLTAGIIEKKHTNEGLLLKLLGCSGLLYLVIVARGNVQHDYYQIPLLPILTIYLGKGLVFLAKLRKENSYIFSVGMIVVSLFFMVAFSWYTIRGYYWINHPELIKAGQAADFLIPKDAKVIAPYNGDTTFLYQIRRQGWPIGFDIDKKIEMGATHYVTISPTDNDGETKDLASRYTVLLRNETFAIIDLTKKK